MGHWLQPPAWVMLLLFPIFPSAHTKGPCLAKQCLPPITYNPTILYRKSMNLVSATCIIKQKQAIKSVWSMLHVLCLTRSIFANSVTYSINKLNWPFFSMRWCTTLLFVLSTWLMCFRPSKPINCSLEENRFSSCNIK